MPFITARVNIPINKEQELKIKSGLGKAIELVPGKSEEYLLLNIKDECHMYLLRYATIVDTRPTTHFDEILKVVHEAGIDETLFTEKYRSAEAEEVLRSDLLYTQSLGICSLPAYLLQYGDNGMLINALVGYDDFADAIGKLTDGRIMPQPPEISDTAVAELIRKRKLICSVELKEAFGIQDALLMEMLDRMRDAGKIEMYPVKNEWYIKVRT